MSVWGMSVWVWVREEVRFYRFCESLGSTNIFIWIWKKICVDQQRYSRMHAYHIHREFHGSTYIVTHTQRTDSHPTHSHPTHSHPHTLTIHTLTPHTLTPTHSHYTRNHIEYTHTTHTHTHTYSHTQTHRHTSNSSCIFSWEVCGMWEDWW